MIDETYQLPGVHTEFKVGCLFKIEDEKIKILYRIIKVEFTNNTTNLQVKRVGLITVLWYNIREKVSRFWK